VVTMTELVNLNLLKVSLAGFGADALMIQIGLSIEYQTAV